MSRHGRGRGHSVLESLGIGALSFGAGAGAIGATYKVAEALVKVKRLFDVRSENEVFVRLTERVQIDLVEVERLMALKEVMEALRHNPKKVFWIQENIRMLRTAIEGMNKYTRKVAMSGWWLGIKTRIWWVLDEYEKLIHREMELGMARDGVLAVIEYLSQFEPKPEKKEKKEEIDVRKYTDVRREGDRRYKEVDVDIDVRRSGRRVIDLDYEGRPRRDNFRDEYDEYDKVDEINVEKTKSYSRSELARLGFYVPEFDGPLSTRPRFSGAQPRGADFVEKKKRVVREETVENEIPLRVHWPSRL